MKINHVVGRLCLLLLTMSLFNARAATFYVATTGSDSNPGTSAQPFRTITYAYSKASAGTTILVAPGTYTDYTSGWGLHLGKGGTASSPIVLESQVPGGAVIDGQFASDRNTGIYIDGSYNIVDGFVITRAPGSGIVVYGNSNQILNDEIYNNSTQGTTDHEGQGIYSGEGTDGNIYEGNYIHDNGYPGSNLDHGLYLCGQNEIVANNVVIGQPSAGLQIAGYSTVSNMKVYNNVFAWNGSDGIIVWMAINGADIKNNIIYQNGHWGIYFFAATGSGVVMDHNLIYGNGSGSYSPFNNSGSTVSYTLGTTISSDPKLANETSSSFDAHLSAGSPAIGAGLNLDSTITTDMAGALRAVSGAWDLGAYVYATTNITPPTVSITTPTNGAIVSGSGISVLASASSSVGIAGVQFKLDGADIGSVFTNAPYGGEWNSTTVANGAHTFTAVATDTAGNQTTASTVTVQVNNVTNTAPDISSISDQTVVVGQVIGPLAFTVSDTETAADSLIVSCSSSNPTLVPSAGIVFGGSGSNRTLTLTPALSQTGTATITLTVSDGQLIASTSFLVTVNATTNGLTFASTSGVISAPFVAGSGVISQPAYTSVTNGGRAAYTFTIANAGDYTVSALVNASSTDENSFFVNIDADPTDPTMVWDVPVTSGLADQTVSWRGNGVVDTNSPSGMTAQFAPKIFNLSTGVHQLIICGREGNVQLGTITIAAVNTATPPTVSITAPANDATVAGSGVLVSADATSSAGIASVQFKLDGTNLGSAFTTAPYAGDWDSTTAANGTHTLTAVATDTAGNQATATPVTILVSNTVVTPPAVTVSATTPNASRVGPTNGVFTITRSGSVNGALAVNYSLGGTAVNGADYGSLGASATIPAGATSTIITIAPLPSASYVNSKTAVLTLLSNSAYTSGSANSATVTIAGNSVASAISMAAGHTVKITWNSVVGKVYVVAYKTSLRDTAWTSLSGPITATGASTSYTDTTASEHTIRYYLVYVTD
jgi:Bacterial Ig domain/Protein of unknown function (DUF1565)